MRPFRIMLYLVAGAFLFPTTSLAQTKSAQDSRPELMKELGREMAQSGGSIQLEALEIRAKIYEPRVFYVLDRAKVDVDFKEEKLQFTPRIEEPIVNNDF